MMAERPGELMSEAEARAFAEKIEAWAQTLTPPERTVLRYALARAAATDPADVQGYLGSRFRMVGADAQLANVDLQNVLQRQQQILQMLSFISKGSHDTTMASIRKLGG